MSNLDQHKRTLQNKRTALSKLEGKEEALLEELKNHGFDNFNTLEADLVTLDEEIDLMEGEQEEGVSKFEEKFATLLEVE